MKLNLGILAELDHRALTIRIPWAWIGMAGMIFGLALAIVAFALLPPEIGSYGLFITGLAGGLGGGHLVRLEMITAAWVLEERRKSSPEDRALWEERVGR
ncbi:MAG: hypothetical protein A2143_08130 [Gallionellales bacterium RBG_16_57_15]|nr:MAG: hypothetical protein A2143_08130 [Gallionellales bacterium RBG_16_57_15]